MGMTAILGEPDVAARSAEEREERMVAQLRGYAAMTGNARCEEAGGCP